MIFIQILFILFLHNCPLPGAIEEADKSFFAMIDEETERRVAELEAEERAKSKSPKAQKTNGVEGTSENHHDAENEGTAVNGGAVSNGHHKANGHTNGHAE